MHFLLNMLLFVLCFSVPYLLVRFLILRTRKNKFNLNREICLYLFFAYLVALFSQTLTPNGSYISIEFSVSAGKEYYNFIPFTFIKTLQGLSGEYLKDYFIVNIIGNIVVFIPLGFFINLLISRRAWLSVLYGAVVSAFIEAFQIFLPRMTDIDDIILNTAGVGIGVILFVIYGKLFPKAVKKIVL